jgi:hypothetical protein
MLVLPLLSLCYYFSREASSFEVRRKHIVNLTYGRSRHSREYIFDQGCDSQERQLAIQKCRDCYFVRGI